MPTIASIIDKKISNAANIRNPKHVAELLADVFDDGIWNVSKEEYFEFVKRNLETHTKEVLEQLKENLR